ncbi:MAG: hypothetical protein R3211_01870 [Balneolaceae bacterium]|nr:hypothetical protein [Balneolaceae bacterium]
MNIREWPGKITRFMQTELGKTILKWSQRIINLGVLVWLFIELTNIGWSNVWTSLPTTPWFYLLFILIYFQLPLFEVLIYRITWSFDSLHSIPAFLLKRVYNKDVLGYSGEFYFYLWARKTVNLKESEIIKIIKDNNIISSIASTFISLLLLSVFLYADQIKILDWVAKQNLVYLIGGAVLVLIAAGVFVKFRRVVITMPMKTAYKIFGIQNFRLLLGQVFNVLMYYVVLPDIPLYIWFTYIAVEIVLTRIPFLPNQDLIFTGMGISMAKGLAVSTSAIAGILVARTVLNKVSNFIFFGLSHFLKQSNIVPDPEDPKPDFSLMSSDAEQTERPDS